MKKFYLLSVILFLLSSCVSSPWLVNETNVYVDEKVADLIYSDRTLTIFPFSDKIVTVNNLDDITKVYDVDSSYAATLVRDSLYYYICHQSTSAITNVILNDVVIPIEISEASKSMSNYSTIKKKFGY